MSKTSVSEILHGDYAETSKNVDISPVEPTSAPVASCKLHVEIIAIKRESSLIDVRHFVCKLALIEHHYL